MYDVYAMLSRRLTSERECSPAGDLTRGLKTEKPFQGSELVSRLMLTIDALTDFPAATKVTQPTFKKVGTFMCGWLCFGRGSEARIRQPLTRRFELRRITATTPGKVLPDEFYGAES